MDNSGHPLAPLIGEPVNEIIFVMDYFQVGFNGPRLTCLTAGSVELPSGERFVFPQPHSRDALCGLIGAVVDRVEDDERALRLNFRDERVLSIPLDDASRVGPEAATFTMGQNAPVIVW